MIRFLSLPGCGVIQSLIPRRLDNITLRYTIRYTFTLPHRSTSHFNHTSVRHCRAKEISSTSLFFIYTLWLTGLFCKTATYYCMYPILYLLFVYWLGKVYFRSVGVYIVGIFPFSFYSIFSSLRRGILVPLFCRSFGVRLIQLSLLLMCFQSSTNRVALHIKGWHQAT